VAVVVLDHRDRVIARRIRDLQRASYTVEADLIGFDQLPPLVEEVEHIIDLSLTILGWSAGGELRGLLGYVRTGDVVDIDRLAVSPAYFRRRIAQSLMEALHQREATASRFEVSTGADNGPAFDLYRKLGYERVGSDSPQGVRVVHFARTAR
jgi:ribosomal protein S18 acetylase RimI-like enzyme